MRMAGVQRREGDEVCDSKNKLQLGGEKHGVCERWSVTTVAASVWRQQARRHSTAKSSAQQQGEEEEAEEEAEE